MIYWCWNTRYTGLIICYHLKLELILYLYARYLCSRDALGLKAGQARRATIGSLVYKYFIIIKQIQELVAHMQLLIGKYFGWWLITLHSNITWLTSTHSLDGSGGKIKTLTLYSDPSLVYKIPYRRAPRLAYRLHRPSASREQRYLAYKP